MIVHEKKKVSILARELLKAIKRGRELIARDRHLEKLCLGLRKANLPIDCRLTTWDVEYIPPHSYDVEDIYLGLVGI